MPKKPLYFTVAGGLKFSDELMHLIDEHDKKYSLHGEPLITGVYDAFPGSLFSGGRGSYPSYNMSLEKAKQIILDYKARGVTFRLLLSNGLLREQDFESEEFKFEKELLQFLHDNQAGEVTLSVDRSEVLNYFRDKGPYFNVPRVRSIVHSPITSLRTFDEKTEGRFHLFCLPPDLNRHFEDMEAFRFKQKIEILVNENCVTGCRFRERHYNLIDRIERQAGKILLEKEQRLVFCIHEAEEETERDGSLKLTRPEIEKINQIGIHRFKIAGRERSWQTLKNDIKEYCEKVSLVYRGLREPSEI